MKADPHSGRDGTAGGPPDRRLGSLPYRAAADSARMPIEGLPASSAPPDDPEQRFRRLPGLLGRLGPALFWRRLRLPRRRRRWAAGHAEATAAYAKVRLAGPPKDVGPEQDKARVVVLGDFGGDTGIARSASYELPHLEAAFPGLVVIDGDATAPGTAPIPLTAPPIDRLIILAAPDNFARLLAHLPPERIAHAWRTALWVWEAPQLAPEWDFAFDLVHEIWTPSAYSAAAIAPRAAPHGIEVIVRPHRVPPPPAVTPAAAAAARAELGIPGDAFLGLAVMDIRSCPARKNPWAHIAAWAAAFGTSPRHRLVLKIRVSKRTAIVRQELETMIRETGASVHLIEGHLPDEALAALMAAADVHLSLHRAEGYGLVIAEMLARGTPVVATDWSANAEYGPSFANYHAVPYRLVPCRDWTAHFPDRRFDWAEPRIAAAAKILAGLAAEAENRRHAAPPSVEGEESAMARPEHDLAARRAGAA
ncbi:MAG: glycosyltransferase [Pseudomonadota bacterium]